MSPIMRGHRIAPNLTLNSGTQNTDGAADDVTEITPRVYSTPQHLGTHPPTPHPLGISSHPRLASPFLPGSYTLSPTSLATFSPPPMVLSSTPFPLDPLPPPSAPPSRTDPFVIKLSMSGFLLHGAVMQSAGKLHICS